MTSLFVESMPLIFQLLPVLTGPIYSSAQTCRVDAALNDNQVRDRNHRLMVRRHDVEMGGLWSFEKILM
ncbi:hypothetical protein ATB98_06000 [Sinorhizobium saheli]|uniref:Uncharacterized protein n=1 Tax=Sinorhizobium saheli TaxID=36856 RepID=A0A178Y320_SINSA|nr:hypothetical protein ATB98_06000 [Sinorhizobium saheli]